MCRKGEQGVGRRTEYEAKTRMLLTKIWETSARKRLCQVDSGQPLSHYATACGLRTIQPASESEGVCVQRSTRTSQTFETRQKIRSTKPFILSTLQ